MAWDKVWETVFRSQAWGQYPGEDLIRFVARNFYTASERRAVRLLEVGCGPGANLWFMAREGFSVYGIDGSEAAVAQAKCRLDTDCPGWSGRLNVGDIEALTFPDAYFDAVIDNEAVYCNDYETSQRIYREMARVTKPAGKLFCRTFAAGSWGDGTGKCVGQDAWEVAEGPMQGKGFSRFTRAEQVADLLAGFDVTSLELIAHSHESRTKTVQEWVIQAEKRGNS